MGVDPLLDAAVAQVEEADLADLLSFLTFASVAQRAGVRPATVQHHFAKRDSDAKPNERLAQAAVLRLIGGERMRATDGVSRASEAAGELRTRPETTMENFRTIAAATLRANLADSGKCRATLLTAAAAGTDATAASILDDWYGEFAKVIVPLYSTLVDAFDRRFDTEAGFDPRSYAVLMSALVDGLVLRHQFDPDAVDPEVYGEFVVRSFEACTIEQTGVETAPVDARLLRRQRIHAPVPPGSTLDPEKRIAVFDAAGAIYDADGVAGLTIAAVARLAGVSRSTVTSHVGDVSGLAAAVCARFLPDLERRIQRDHDRGRPSIGVIERHFARVAEIVQEHTELSAAAYEASVRVRAHGRITGLDPAQLQSVAPLPHVVVPIIIASADQFRPGYGELEAAFDLASALTDLVVSRALTNATSTPADIVDNVMDLVLEGARAR